MRKILAGIISVVVMLSLAAINRSNASETPLFHGFSSNNDLIISTDSELLWLQPDAEMPVNSLPCSKSYLLPEANTLYIQIDENIMSVDFDFTEIMTLDFEFFGEPTLQAKGDIVIASDYNGSHIFFKNQHIKSSDTLLTLGQTKNNLQIVTYEGKSGLLLLDKETANIESTEIGSVFSFWDGGIVAITNDRSFAHLLNLDTLEVVFDFPASDCYFIKGSHLFSKQFDKTFIINPADLSSRLELPEFDKSQIYGDIYIGFDSNTGYTALSVPNLEVIHSNPAVKLGDWVWFKNYKDFIVISSDQTSNFLVNKSTGVISEIDCKPVSYFNTLFLCQDDGYLSFLDVSTNTNYPQIQLDAHKPNLLSYGFGMANILYENSDGESLISTINVSTGDLVQTLKLNPNIRILVGAPVEYSQVQQGSILFDADSIESIRNSGFNHATPLFFDSEDHHKVLVTSPSDVEITTYILGN